MWTDDITNARTLPSSFYRDKDRFKPLVRKLFSTRWQYLGSTGELVDHNAIPVTLLPGVLDEPFLLTRDTGGTIRCLSNVCTHRGSTLLEAPADTMLLQCPYHGRCFELNGRFRAMAGFEGVRDFPSEQDDLPVIDTHVISQMIFGRIEGQRTWREQFEQMSEVMHWYPWDNLSYAPQLSRDFEIDAHWMLYIENYLEGLHVPFVHPALNTALQVPEYQINVYESASLQIGVARDNETSVFDLPGNVRWQDQRIYALYWFVFPNLMFNYYPWGISLNVVEPVEIDHTRVRFITFQLPGVQPDIASIHQTEVEDEAIVERVQRGVRSSFYQSGRYAPLHEKAVHHFHRLVLQAMG
jgi:choline monooxygenase